MSFIVIGNCRYKGQVGLCGLNVRNINLYFEFFCRRKIEWIVYGCRAMIPENLRTKVEQQPGNVYRSDSLAVYQALNDLGVARESEFGAFFREYVVTCFLSAVSDEELCDLIEPTAEILMGTQFVHTVWCLPDNFICLSSIQGEGAYLYDRNSGCVWDFYLSKRDDFLSGVQSPGWESFFEFMDWYLVV